MTETTRQPSQGQDIPDDQHDDPMTIDEMSRLLERARAEATRLRAELRAARHDLRAERAEAVVQEASGAQATTDRAVERVARAIHSQRFLHDGDDPDAIWANYHGERTEAYALAKAAITAWFAGPTPEDRGSAWKAIQTLVTGLHRRGVLLDGDQPGHAVDAALAVLDAAQDVVDQHNAVLDAAQDVVDQHNAAEPVELTAEWGGLTAEQEIRDRALGVAARVLSGRDAYNLGDVAVMDAAAATVALAARLVRFLADGRPCTCLAEPGEHPHTARGCDIQGCGCRWVPPAVDGREG